MFLHLLGRAAQIAWSIPLSCPVVNRYPFLLPPLLLKDLLIGSQSSMARSLNWVLQLEPKPVPTLILNVMLIRFILNQNHRQAVTQTKIFPKSINLA